MASAAAKSSSVRLILEKKDVSIHTGGGQLG